MSKNSNHRRKRQGGEGPELRLIGGGRAESTRSPSSRGAACEDSVRDGVVTRARDRVASGYYRRSEVIERLVELLWDELYAP